MIQIKFLLEKPKPPAIISSATDIHATSLAVKWTAPIDDGGSPITAYRVVILKGDTEIKNVNITDPGITSLSVGDLARDTEYNVKVFPRNAVFEGASGQKTIRTKINGEMSNELYNSLQVATQCSIYYKKSQAFSILLRKTPFITSP